MRKKIDIERLLKRAPIGTGPRVKRAVLSRYAQRYGSAPGYGDAQRYGSAQGVGGTIHFWRKPVPLYLAAAFVLVIAVLSFMGGRRFSPPERKAQSRAAVAQDSPACAGHEQLWHFTQRDAL